MLSIKLRINSNREFWSGLIFISIFGMNTTAYFAWIAEQYQIRKRKIKTEKVRRNETERKIEIKK